MSASALPAPPSYRLVFDQALCHASLLIERLLFYNRSLGLLPRTTTADDPLGPIVVSDEDVATIFAGFRRLARTEPRLRPDLLSDPLSAEIAASRAALAQVLADPAARGLGFVEIAHAFKLSDAALDAFLLALAPEWDARLGRLFGFLNNDTTRQRPTLGHLHLAMQQGLPTFSVAAQQTLEQHLLRPGLIELDTSSESPKPALLCRVPGHVVELTSAVLPADADSADPPLPWERLHFAEADKRAFAAALQREMTPRAERHRLIILEATPGSGRRAAVRAAALPLALPCCDCALRPAPAAQLEREIAAALLRARVRGGVLLLRSDGVLGDKAEVWRRLADLTQTLQVCCLVLVRPNEPLPEESGISIVRLAPPRLFPAQRRQIWQDAVGAAGLSAEAATLDHLSMRFDSTPGRILELCGEVALRRAGQVSAPVTVEEASAAMRDITTQKLKDAASLHIADQGLSDLILEPAAHERLQELIHRMQYRYEVLDGWRFGGRSQRGHSVTALFAGPPGTGKTAAAGAVARALQIDLYIVDLSRVMSKWIGETEQNLARIFDEAEASSVALLFDEADSLFGKRSSEMKSASDRYANVTVNYLLQRMERYSGLAILTTNLESAIDTAFSRRISSRVYFPDPDEDQRRKLWQGLLPPGVRYGDNVDLDQVVRALVMPGARIRSALLRASFRAAALGRRERVLTQEDLHWAAVLEYEDMGRLPPKLYQTESDDPAPADSPLPLLADVNKVVFTRPAAPDFPFPKR